jgi:hypothetical protein
MSDSSLKQLIRSLKKKKNIYKKFTYVYVTDAWTESHTVEGAGGNQVGGTAHR